MMSDLMLFGVLRMPYEMAMADEMARGQYWRRGQEAVDRITALEAENALMRKGLNTLAKYEADENEMDWAETVLEMNAIARNTLAALTQEPKP